MTSTATTARKSGGDVASLDDAWAKINSGKKRGNDNDANGRGKDETTLEDVMMDVVMANNAKKIGCLLYTSPSPRDATLSRMPSSA